MDARPASSRRRLLAGVGVAATHPATLARAAAAEVPAPDPAPAGGAPRSTELRTSDGVRLRLLVAAPERPAAPPLVLVPGWGMPATVFLAQLQALGRERQVVAVDPRGQGESEVPAQGYTVDRRADDLRDVLAPLPPVVLVGWSLGVLEALHYVHRHGDQRLAGLVLVDNSVGEPPPPRPSDFLKRLRADRAAAVDGFVRSMFATPRPPEQIDEIVRSVLRTPLAASIALLSYPLPREHWRALARGFRKPLAYLITPRWAAQADSLKTHRPATRVEVFEQAGHALFVDEPERFNAVLAAFCRELENPAPPSR